MFHPPKNITEHPMCGNDGYKVGQIGFMLAMLLVPALRGERSLLCHERYWDSWPPEEEFNPDPG